MKPNPEEIEAAEATAQTRFKNRWVNAIELMAQLDWRKVSDDPQQPVFFEGTLLRQGKVIPGRGAYERAAEKLSDTIQELVRKRGEGHRSLGSVLTGRKT